MWFKEKCSRITNSFVVSRQCQRMILPGSHLFLPLIYLRKLESPWALVSLLGNIRLFYSSWGIHKVQLIHVFKLLGDVLEWRVNYRLAMPALKIETRWIKPSPSQGNTVLDRREGHSNASELSQRTAKQWRETSAVLLLISFLALYSNIIQPVLFWTRSMSWVKCQSTVTAQRLHFRDGVNVTAIVLEFQEKPLKSLLWWDYYRAIMMQECNTTAILIKVYGSQG